MRLETKLDVIIETQNNINGRLEKLEKTLDDNKKNNDPGEYIKVIQLLLCIRRKLMQANALINLLRILLKILRIFY